MPSVDIWWGKTNGDISHISIVTSHHGLPVLVLPLAQDIEPSVPTNLSRVENKFQKTQNYSENSSLGFCSLRTPSSIKVWISQVLAEKHKQYQKNTKRFVTRNRLTWLWRLTRQIEHYRRACQEGQAETFTLVEAVACRQNVFKRASILPFRHFKGLDEGTQKIQDNLFYLKSTDNGCWSLQQNTSTEILVSVFDWLNNQRL